jgi:hypothetical protein
MMQVIYLKVGCEDLIILLNNLIDQLIPVCLSLFLHVLRDVNLIKLGTKLLTCSCEELYM